MNLGDAGGARLVLFAFDDVCMPWRYRVRLHMRRPEKYAGNPIVRRGPPGAADERRAADPCVVADGSGLSMWYLGMDGVDDLVASYDSQRVCLAQSSDGLEWEKPSLGLVEHRRSTENNLVAVEPGAGSMDILLDPDVEGERRFLMATEFMPWRHTQKLPTLERPSITRFASSADGLRWRMRQDAPGVIAQHYEVFCLYRFRGLYHLAGHQGPPGQYAPLQRHGPVWMCGPRMMTVWRSPEVDRWPTEDCVAFFRPMQSSSPYLEGWDREEVHLGAYVTPRRNVCLGLTGQWHHPITDSPPEHPEYLEGEAAADIGFVLSNDGVHFREPAPGFTFIARDQELRWDRDFRDNTNDKLLLVQGPIINRGEQTLFYYTAYTPTGNSMVGCSNIGVAYLPRDRYGYLTPVPDARHGTVRSASISAGESDCVFVNVEMEEGAHLEAALTDPDGLRELEGFTMADSLAVRTPGLREPIRWRGRTGLPREPFCLRVTLAAGSRLYAAYLEGEST